MSRARALLTLALTMVGVCAAAPAEATHLFGGALRWRVPDPSAPKTVELIIDVGQRSDGLLDPVMIDFGDGTTAQIDGLDATSAALQEGPASNYRVRRHTVLHPYPAFGSYAPHAWLCCLASNIVNADAFNLQAGVDLALGNKGSVAVSVPPVVYLQTGGVRTYKIPAKDPDGVPFTCRWAQPGEAPYGGNPPVIPGGAAPTITTEPDGCLITWDTTGATAGQMIGVPVAIDSFAGAGKSVTPVAFVAFMRAAPPPVCNDGGVIEANLGVPLTVSFLGKSFVPGHMRFGTIGLFGELTPPDGTSGVSPFGVSLSVTPLPGDEGLHPMNVVYRDGTEANGDCAALVSVAPCPSYGMPCSTGVGACAQTGDLYCSGGQVVCSATAGLPSAEACNGVDDDCDGAVDNGDPGAGLPCSTGLFGPCGAGTTECSSGATVCTPKVLPGSTVDTCNGVDDDCDGIVDPTCGAGGSAGQGASGAQGSSTGAGGQGASGSQGSSGGQGASGAQGGSDPQGGSAGSATSAGQGASSSQGGSTPQGGSAGSSPSAGSGGSGGQGASNSQGGSSPQGTSSASGGQGASGGLTTSQATASSGPSSSTGGAPLPTGCTCTTTPARGPSPTGLFLMASLATLALRRRRTPRGPASPPRNRTSATSRNARRWFGSC